MATGDHVTSSSWWDLCSSRCARIVLEAPTSLWIVSLYTCCFYNVPECNQTTLNCMEKWRNFSGSLNRGTRDQCTLFRVSCIRARAESQDRLNSVAQNSESRASKRTDWLCSMLRWVMQYVMMTEAVLKTWIWMKLWKRKKEWRMAFRREW
jgi:hypothetical protein